MTRMDIKTCERKVRYRTRKMARRRSAYMSEPIRVYFCALCKGFHITKRGRK